MVTRANLVAQLSARDASYPDPPGVFLCLHSTSFDSSVAGIFWTLRHGGTLVFLDAEARRDPRAILDALRRHEVTHLDIPPSLYAEVLASPAFPDAARSLRRVIVGGEELPAYVARRHLALCGHATLTNEYGPTECTVYCATWDVQPPVGERVPIGRPAAGTRAYVLDRYGGLLPRGLPGELSIAGPQVARGYHARPDLTAARFVDDPRLGERVYRTGDRVQVDDGALVFLGRGDGQVQVQGHRVELAEVERALARLPGVEQAVVAARSFAGATRLLGYAVPTAGAELDPAALREGLTRLLPRPMVPAAIGLLPRIPRTPAGKVDRAALPELAASTRRFRPPRNATERQVAALFAEELGVPQVGIDDDFFELGGSSIVAIRLVRRLQSIADDPTVGVSIVYAHPRVASLAAALTGGDRSVRYVVPIRRTGARRPLFGVHVLGVGQSFYRPLAKHLGPDQPLFGLDSAMVDGEAPPTDVPSLARLYIEAMREVAPSGPYQLLAVSLAGMVAFEMAVQLRAQGEEVSLLGLFDAMGPTPPRMSRRERLRMHWAELQQQGIAYLGSRLERRYHLVRDAALARAIAVWRKTGVEPPASLRVLEVMYQNLEATLDYAPRPYAGRLTIFRAMERAFYPPSYVEEGFGWAGLAKDIDVLDVPGDHLGMLAPPNVAALARVLRDACDRTL